jgi:hypothetical protein
MGAAISGVVTHPGCPESPGDSRLDRGFADLPRSPYKPKLPRFGGGFCESPSFRRRVSLEVVIFAGPNARERAIRYADRQCGVSLQGPYPYAR